MNCSWKLLIDGGAGRLLLFAFKLSELGGDRDHIAVPFVEVPLPLLWLPFSAEDRVDPFDCCKPNCVAFVSDFSGLAGSK